MVALHSKESMVNVQNQDWRVLSTAEIVNLKFERLNSIGYLYLIFFNGVNCRNKIASSCICSKTLSEKANKEKMIIHWELYVEKMYSAS